MLLVPAIVLSFIIFKPAMLLNIIFKVFEDGVGFRYEFPQQPNLKYFIVAEEMTEFNLTGNHKTFWIPGDFDSNEYLYTTSKLSEVDAWKFPMISSGDWDDTKIIEAEPGDYITIARKEKGKNTWFIGAITDENSRQTFIALDFLTKGIKYQATIYSDAETADWKNNPEAYTIKKTIIDNTTTLQIKLANGGGAAISIMPVSASNLKALK